MVEQVEQVRATHDPVVITSGHGPFTGTTARGSAGNRKTIQLELACTHEASNRKAPNLLYKRTCPSRSRPSPFSAVLLG
jgi:hypothetical protein